MEISENFKFIEIFKVLVEFNRVMSLFDIGYQYLF